MPFRSLKRNQMKNTRPRDDIALRINHDGRNTHAQQQNVRKNNVKNSHIFLGHMKYFFSSKNMVPGWLRFHVVST